MVKYRSMSRVVGMINDKYHIVYRAVGMVTVVSYQIACVGYDINILPCGRYV